MSKQQIPTWGLVVMLASGLVGLYFLSRDLIERLS